MVRKGWSRNTSDYMYVDMEDFPQFYESLKSVEAGKHAEELLLSGEGFHMAWFERDMRVSKHRLDGKNSVIILSSRDLRSVLEIFEKIQEMRGGHEHYNSDPKRGRCNS